MTHDEASVLEIMGCPAGILWKPLQEPSCSQGFVIQAETTPHLLPFWRPLSNLQAETWELLSFRLRQPFDMRITCSAGKQILLRYHKNRHYEPLVPV